MAAEVCEVATVTVAWWGERGGLIRGHAVIPQCRLVSPPTCELQWFMVTVIPSDGATSDVANYYFTVVLHDGLDSLLFDSFCWCALATESMLLQGLSLCRHVEC